MMRLAGILFILLAAPWLIFAQDERVAVAKAGAGDWHDKESWESGIVPDGSGGDIWVVEIPETASLSLGTAVSIDKLKLRGSLALNAPMTVASETNVYSGRFLGPGSVEFRGQLSVSGDIGNWECDVLITGSASFEDVSMIFVTSRINSTTSGRFEIAAGALLEVVGSLTLADRPIGTKIGGGFVNNGRIRFVHSGESVLQLDQNEGIVEIGEHTVTVQGGETELAGSFMSSASGKLIAASTRFSGANLDLAGELEVKGISEITGGRIRAEVVDIHQGGLFRMNRIFDTLVSRVTGGMFKLESSAFYVSDSISIQSGQITLENSRLDVTNGIDASDSWINGSGVINGSMRLENSTIHLNDGLKLTINGDLRLEQSTKVPPQAAMVVYFYNTGFGEPVLDVFGAASIDGGITLERGNQVDMAEVQSFEILHATDLEFGGAFPETGDYSVVDKDLLARLWYGVDSPYGENNLTIDDFRILNPWLVAGFPDIMNLPPKDLLPASDPDNDGLTNQEEFIFGSWPLDPADIPQLELALRHQTLGNAEDNQFVWFRALPNSAPYDVRVELEVSYDLSHWDVVPYLQFEDSTNQERDFLLETLYLKYRFLVATDKSFYVRLAYELTGPVTYPELPAK